MGGELQKILEENYAYKVSSHSEKNTLYNSVDKMLRIIIDRVKEIESDCKLLLILMF